MVVRFFRFYPVIYGIADNCLLVVFIRSQEIWQQTMKFPASFIRAFVPGYTYPFSIAAFITDNALAMVTVLQDAYLAFGTEVLSVVR